MIDKKQTADKLRKVSDDFDRLTTNHRRMTKMLLDALAPDVKQRDRDELRKVFAPYVEETPARQKSADQPGDTDME
jgi:hypothetical protein